LARPSVRTVEEMVNERRRVIRVEGPTSVRCFKVAKLLGMDRCRPPQLQNDTVDVHRRPLNLDREPLN
jgi:hypothetical protein